MVCSNLLGAAGAALVGLEGLFYRRSHAAACLLASTVCLVLSNFPHRQGISRALCREDFPSPSEQLVGTQAPLDVVVTQLEISTLPIRGGPHK